MLIIIAGKFTHEYSRTIYLTSVCQNFRLVKVHRAHMLQRAIQLCKWKGVKNYFKSSNGDENLIYGLYTFIRWKTFRICWLGSDLGKNKNTKVGDECVLPPAEKHFLIIILLCFKTKLLKVIVLTRNTRKHVVSLRVPSNVNIVFINGKISFLYIRIYFYTVPRFCSFLRVN